MPRQLIILAVAAAIIVAALAAVSLARKDKPLFRAPSGVAFAPAADTNVQRRCGGGCCSLNNSPDGGRDAGLQRNSRAEKLALDFYVSRYGDTDVKIEIRDFGCHMEAYVFKGTKMVKRLSINGNSISEIG